MPISSREDYLLRMIRELGAVIARMRGLAGGGQLHEAMHTLDDAEGELLGPLAEVAPLLDSATAAHMVAEPRRIAAWARLLYERADLLRQAGDHANADLAATRALELAREAVARGEASKSAIEEILGPALPPAG
jgi:hypothetical protein